MQTMKTINLPSQVNPYIPRSLDVALNQIIIENPTKLIEVWGTPYTGKSSLVSQWIHSQRTNEDNAQNYSWVAWIDCSTITTAHQHIIHIIKAIHRAKESKEPKEPKKLKKSKESKETGTLEEPPTRENTLSLEAIAKLKLPEAIEYIVNACEIEGSEKPCLLIFDNLNDLSLLPHTLINLVLERKVQIIYTTTNSQLSKQLNETVEIMPWEVKTFTIEETKPYLEKTLTKLGENWALDEENASEIVGLFYKKTGGLPGYMVHYLKEYEECLECGIYEFLQRDGIVFSLNQGSKESVKENLKQSLTQSLQPLIEESKTNKIAKKALKFIQHSVYLGPQFISYQYSVARGSLMMRKDLNLPDDFTVIKKLHGMCGYLFNFNKREQTYKIPEYYQEALKALFAEEKITLIQEVLARLHQLFSYLTINDYDVKHEVATKKLAPLVPAIHYFIFNEVVNLSSKELKLIHSGQLMELWSSLGRFYYLYYGELSLALNCLETGRKFIEERLAEQLPPKLVRAYQQPQGLVALNLPALTTQQGVLLTLYAREFLYQLGNLTSQLSSREQNEQNNKRNLERSVDLLKRAYWIQARFAVRNDYSIAYTLRSLTRAMRKNGMLMDEIKPYFDSIEALQATIQDEKVYADLAYDKGIVLKEEQDKLLDEDKRDYKPAIEILNQAKTQYIKINQRNKDKRNYSDSATICIYLGDAFVAGKQTAQVLEGIQNYCHALKLLADIHKPNSTKHARIYHALAIAFYDIAYYGLAHLFVEKCLPLQKQHYGEEHNYFRVTSQLQIMIQQKLIEESQSPILVTSETLEKYKISDAQTSSALENIIYQQLSTLKVDNNLLQETDHILRYKHQLQKISEEKNKIEKKKELIVQMKETSKEILENEQGKNANYYEELKLCLTNPLAKQFADEFAEQLLNQVIHKIQVANGENTKLDKSQTTEGIVNALANLIPKIEGGMEGVKGSINIAAVVQGITTTLVNRHVQIRKTEAHLVKEGITQLGHDKVYDEIKSIVKEMATYAASCYQPLFIQLKNDEEKQGDADITSLAKQAANRVVSYEKKGWIKFDFPLEELVIHALQGQQGKQELHHEYTQGKHWYVNGFFGKCGVTIYNQKQKEKVYIKDIENAKPDKYGYRFGSPLEVKKANAYPSPKAAEDAIRAEKAKQKFSTCTIS